MKFGDFNPKVCFLFFIFAVILTLLVFNPIFIAASLAAGGAYSVILGSIKKMKSAVFLFAFILAAGIFNMIFSSYGMTELFSIGYKSFNLEPLCYGLCQGAAFSAVFVWMSNYSAVISSEKFLSVFSFAAPNVTLVLAMTFSFIPRIVKNAGEINDALKNTDYTAEKSGFGLKFGKIKKSLNAFSALVSLTLEESIETSDSMRARGFNKNRRAYSKYGFSLYDGIMLIFVIILFAALCVTDAFGMGDFIFDPQIKSIEFSAAFFAAYVFFMALPIVIDLKEAVKWQLLKQRI